MRHGHREKSWGPAKPGDQVRPVEAGTRIVLPTWGDVLMTCHMGNGVAAPQCLAQPDQGRVLCNRDSASFETLKFNAYRVVVAVVPASVMRASGMPGPLIAIDELPQFAIASDVEVRRHFQAADLTEVGVGIPVQLVGEQSLDFVTAILTRRQADRVQHDQVDAGVLGTRAEVGRGQSPGGRVPATLPQRRCRVSWLHGSRCLAGSGCSGVRCGSGSGAGSGPGGPRWRCG